MGAMSGHMPGKTGGLQKGAPMGPTLTILPPIAHSDAAGACYLGSFLLFHYILRLDNHLPRDHGRVWFESCNDLVFSEQWLSLLRDALHIR